MVKKFVQHTVGQPEASPRKANAAGEATMGYTHDSPSKQSRLAGALNSMSHAHKEHSASHRAIRKSMYHGD